MSVNLYTLLNDFVSLDEFHYCAEGKNHPKKEKIEGILNEQINSLRGMEISSRTPEENVFIKMSAGELEKLKVDYQFAIDLLREIQGISQIPSAVRKLIHIADDQISYIEACLDNEVCKSPAKTIDESATPPVEVELSEYELFLALEEARNQQTYNQEIYDLVSSENFDFKKQSREENKLVLYFLEEKQNLQMIHKAYTQTGNEELAFIENYLKVVQGIENQGFVEFHNNPLSYDPLVEKINQQISSIKNSLGDESDTLSLNKVISYLPQIHVALDSLPLRKVQGSLKGEDIQTAFYWLAKYQTEILELERLLGEFDGKTKLTVSPENLQSLVNVASKLSAFQSHFSLPADRITHEQAVPKKMVVSPQEAEERLQLAQSLGPEKNQTTTQENYWLAAQGFVQSKQFDKAWGAFREAALNIQFQAGNNLVTQLSPILEKTSRNPVYITQCGTSCLKDQTFLVSHVQVEGKAMLNFQFKLNGYAKENHNSWIEYLNQPQAQEELKNSKPEGFCPDVRISTRDRHHYNVFKGDRFVLDDGFDVIHSPQLVIEFVGVGKVMIGQCPGTKSINDTVMVEMEPLAPPELLLNKLHTMLSLTGCPPFLVESRQEDMQRKALLGVFRAFYPKQAYLFERSGDNYRLSPEELYSVICAREPAMEALYQAHLDDNFLSKEKIEVSKGKEVEKIRLSEGVIERGGLGLMSGVGSLTSCVHVLRDGFLSSSQRFSRGIIFVGASSYSDIRSGGGESVFTRLVTKELAERVAIKDVPFCGEVQVLIDLKAADQANTYCFQVDQYGTRVETNYFNRDNLLEMTEKLQTPADEIFGTPAEIKKFGSANEVVIRDAISPQYITKVLVSSVENKDKLITLLKENQLLELQGGVYTFHSKPVDEFIIVPENGKFKAEMWEWTK